MNVTLDPTWGSPWRADYKSMDPGGTGRNHEKPFLSIPTIMKNFSHIKPISIEANILLIEIIMKFFNSRAGISLAIPDDERSNRLWNINRKRKNIKPGKEMPE
jgi:hypothetical protein